DPKLVGHPQDPSKSAKESPIKVGKDLVPISRDRFKYPIPFLVLYLSPPPLVIVAVPIPNEHIEYSCLNIRGLIDRIFFIAPQAVEHSFGTDNIVIGTPEAFMSKPVLFRSLLNHIDL